MRYRIGINLGDVIVEGDDIYGDGVNVAARLQALAPVGGVALVAQRPRSGRRQSWRRRSRIWAAHTVKNIERPVHVFAVVGPPTLPRRRGAEKRRVSICVLPFANMSGDTEQEYFSDGISEDIITDLCKGLRALVAARNTAFTFKGKHVDMAQVGAPAEASATCSKAACARPATACASPRS